MCTQLCAIVIYILNIFEFIYLTKTLKQASVASFWQEGMSLQGETFELKHPYNPAKVKLCYLTDCLDIYLNLLSSTKKYSTSPNMLLDHKWPTSGSLN